MKAGISRPGPTKRWRWKRLVLALIVVAVVAIAGFWDQLSGKAERLVLGRLGERGLYLSYKSRGWLPWKGLTFRDVALYGNAERVIPLVTLSNLSAELSWPEIWQNRTFLSRWSTDHAQLTLTDAQGAVTLSEVSAEVQVGSGMLTFKKLAVLQGKVSLSLTGDLRFAKVPEAAKLRDQNASTKAAAKLVPLELSGLRRTLAALDLTGSSEELRIQGTASFDFSATRPRWNVNLSGEGHHLEIRTVPLERFSGSLAFSEKRLDGSAQLTLRQGRITTKVGQEPGENLRFDGTASDAAGKSSRFAGQWSPSDRTLRLSKVSGQADWLALARGLPSVQRALPTSVEGVRFPALTAEELEWRSAREGISAWRVRSLRLNGPAALTLNVAGRPLMLTEILGAGSFDGRTWRLSDARLSALGGTVEASGEWVDDIFARTTIRGTKLQMQRMAPWLGSAKPRLGTGEISFDYAGQIGTRSAQATGHGQVRMVNAPLVEVPLLEQTWQFFSAFVPGPAPNGAGEMTCAFVVERGQVRVADFKAQSQAVSVTGQGTIDLPAQTIEARARGQLRGGVGLATIPLSRLMEMKISGSLKDPRVTIQDPTTVVAGLMKGTGQAALGATELSGNFLKQGASLPLRLWRSLGGTGKPAQFPERTE